jgi:hypothetical protein
MDEQMTSAVGPCDADNSNRIGDQDTYRLHYKSVRSWLEEEHRIPRHTDSDHPEINEYKR